MSLSANSPFYNFCTGGSKYVTDMPYIVCATLLWSYVYKSVFLFVDFCALLHLILTAIALSPGSKPLILGGSGFAG